MRGAFRGALAAHWRAGRVLFLLSVAGVALGVGSVLSIQLLNQGALGAFAGSVRAISGDAQLTVLGRAGTLPDALVAEVVAEPGVRAALPAYRVDVALEDGGSLDVVGTDLFAPVRLPFVRARAPAEVAAPLATRGWVAVAPELAAEQGWTAGSTFEVSSGSRRVRLVVGALVDFRKVAPLASRRLAVMDLAQVQALLGVPGQLHQIDVVAAPGTGLEDLARRLEARLGPGARVTTPEQRVAEAGGLLSAFRLNLTALSLISLFVGGFLVQATTQAALARRREELGLLRCLGATRGEVLARVLAEAAVLGLLGTAAGLPLGWLAARANLEAVSGTLRTVYLLEGVEGVTLGPGLALLGAALGMAGALAGALLPALEVAREDPRALLAPREAGGKGGRGGRLPPRLAAAGLLLAGLASALFLGPLAAWRWGGFALALALALAPPLCAPLLLGAAARLPAPARLGARSGARDLGGRLRSTAVAAGALSVAVAMMAAVTVMVGSFRRTVEDWLSDTLRADVYVTTPSWRRARSEATLTPGLVERLAAEPGVVAVDRLRQRFVEAGGRRVSIAGFDAALPQRRLSLAAGDPAEAMGRLRGEGAALVSEPLARKAGLAVGGTVTVAGPAGPVAFPVAGVYRDYGGDGGALLVDLATLARAFGDGPPSNAALYLAPGVDPEAVVARVRAAFPDQALLVRSNRTLRAEVLAIFEQTFAVTRLLQGMSLVVAVAGITLTLLVLARERAAELALYRALGATRAQLFRVFVGRGLGIAAAGLLLGAAGGAALSLVLVEVVNPAWFGWTIGLHVPWGELAAEAAAIGAAALLASLYPAARASAAPAEELSRDAL